MGESATFSENITRALGRENFANTSPVASAVKTRLSVDSTTTSTFEASVPGYIQP